jgi:general secretion pathway protein L
MSQLLVTLSPPHVSQVELAYALIASSGALTSHGSAVPALLPKADQVTLIVPAQALSWHAAQLPKMPRTSSSEKIQTMLAGVLEDHLLDEPEKLHLVALPSLKTASSMEGLSWVAAMDKAWLQEQVASLQAARLPLTRIVPQVFPSSAASWHASGSAQALWLTCADSQGVFSIPLMQAAWLPALPDDALLTAEPAVAAVVERVVGQRATVIQSAQRALQSAQAALASGVDLAQGALAVTGQGRFWQRLSAGVTDFLAAPAWRPVRWGLALLMLANVVGLNAWSYRQSVQLDANRSEMRQLLTQSFPNVKVVVDAPLQMQRELANLRQAQGQLSGRDFESIYGRFSALAGAESTPDAIEFIANEVQIRGAGLSPSQLDALQARLQYAGLQAKKDALTITVSHRDASALPVSAAGGKP